MEPSDIDVAYVAKLARIELREDEVAVFSAQLGGLLGHIRKLEELPTGDVAATAQVVPSTNVLRDDSPSPSLDRATVLAMAPEAEGGYFRVPRILGNG